MDVLPKFKKEFCGDIKKIEYSSADPLPEDTIYNKIVKLCAKNNINIKELASRAGVKYQTIYAYKNIVKDYK
ncbi:helix-turn-helix transcriptional regulator [Ruminiclostridium cellobioparum]|uniref:helix-turn-helix transcriptional regulator n=1 Tax=Ruminiclostridium cellobioparum TaxID=29355 RepID=UPI0028B089ED|nr:helix-turn-helix transcriptional regulator [Ruminiclostridium cellobioparum]